MTGRLQPGHRVRLPETEGWATATDVFETATGWRVYADTDDVGRSRWLGLAAASMPDIAGLLSFFGQSSSSACLL